MRVEPDTTAANPAAGRASSCGPSTLRRLLTFVLFLSVTATALKPQLAPAGLTDMAPGGEVTFCEYCRGSLSPVVEIHAANVFTDYERLGFFRLGILPLLVADHVQVQVQSASCLVYALTDVQLWHKATRVSRQLEIRVLEITLQGEKEPRLQANLARVGQDGTLRLSELTFRDAEGKQLSVSKATLQISGPFAGRLSWDSGGHGRECLLFQTLNDKKP